MLGATGFIKRGIGIAGIVVGIDVENKKIRVACPSASGFNFLVVSVEEFSPPSDYHRYLEELSSNKEIGDAQFKETKKENLEDKGVFGSPASAKLGGAFS